jgi:tetratricopeptide (TPR) repeat protein
MSRSYFSRLIVFGRGAVMVKMICLTTVWFSLLIAGCGPDTIFLRPGLDTPTQHIENGQQLLQRGKLEDACREFNRAKELDPLFVKAYVSLGIALARKGDLTAASATMDQARRIAGNSQEIAEVRKGYEQLEKIKRHQLGSPSELLENSAP